MNNVASPHLAATLTITTQQAADLLNISRPSLIQLLDEDKLPYRRIGTHRRIPLEAVLAYKAEAYAKRKTALDEMSTLHQELGSSDRRTAPDGVPRRQCALPGRSPQSADAARARRSLFARLV